ncbi:PqqD family protein [Sphingomonas sp.]|uniref:PqqD family protein n=1 Tax=Sphingomonas sp. TaxID=28214 RepID=UPI00181C2113|nr:PqqD family protein [Sphingomonas sp.]MBA4763234.1 PqqD family protein [Sphingomonas sp.]
MVDLETVIVRSDTVLDASVGDESVLMSIETGQYYTMKVTSRAIWERLDTPVRVRDLCAALADAYQAPLETVETDTVAFLNYLEAHKMIERREG